MIGEGKMQNTKKIALDEAQEIIRLLSEDKLKSAEKHIYTGERIGNWWEVWGQGEIELIAKKDNEDV